MSDRATVLLGCLQSATGSHLPLEETASPFAVSPDFTATRWGRGFASGLLCQAPSEGTPQSAARGTLRSGDRAAAGMSRPRQESVGAFASRYGVDLPSEETAPPFAVRPGAWPEGPREAGIGQRRGCRRPHQDIVGAQTARYGVASSFGRDCSALRGPFTSSPFVQPIPQSRRRASDDLFRASLDVVSQ
jgi:hypothetical protein